MRLTALAVFVCSLLAQSQPPQQPAASFKTGTDLLTVESAVFDSDGRAVRDLQPSDFTVTVDGAPRKVLFARFYSTETLAAPNPFIARIPAASAHTSNAATAAGRVVIFVIDRETIRTGSERAMLDAAGIVLDSLSAADAVGLVAIPSGRVDLTREHDRVRDEIRRMTGTMPEPPWRWTITWEEAAGIERGDKQALAEVLNRECRAAVDRAARVEDAAPNVMVTEGCDRNVPMQAMEMLTLARNQAQATLATLGTLVEQLGAVSGPRHIVFLSGGLRFDQQLLAQFDAFSRQAAASGVVLHTIHVDQPSTDAATSRRPITSPFGSRDMSSGLTTIAGMTGGSFFYGVGSAAGVFEKIGAELANYYELGVETTASDADGKAHDIKVEVGRPGLSVRARRQVIVGARPSLASQPDPLKWMLNQPVDIVGLPLAITSYATRGDEASTLRVLLSGEIGASTEKPPVEWGYLVFNEGNVVANGRAKLQPTNPGPWVVTTSAKLVPGKYRLRFGAVDADGRGGVTDIPLTVGLRVAGDLQISDLIVGTADGGRLVPRSRIARGAPGSALIEIYSNDPAQLEKTTAALEIIPSGAADPVQRYLMARRSSPVSGAILIAEGDFPTATLAPGRYTASVVTLLDGQPIGRVSRVFDVTGS